MLDFRYIDLIAFKAYADLRIEVHRYFVGVLWWILEPIVHLLIYYVVFGVLLGRREPGYVQFLFVGLVIWRWMTATILEGAGSIHASRMLIQQVYMPKLVLPTVSIVTQLFKFSFVLVVLVGFLWASGHTPGLGSLRIFAVLAIGLVFVTGMTWLFAGVIPFIPDLRLLLDQAFRLGFFLSGIFYSGRDLGPEYQRLFYLNPFAVVIESVRQVLIDGVPLSWLHLSWVLGLGVVLISAGVLLLSRFDRRYPKVIY